MKKRRQTDPKRQAAQAWLTIQGRRMVRLIVPVAQFGLLRIACGMGQAGCIADVLTRTLLHLPMPWTSLGIFFGLIAVQFLGLLASEWLGFRAGAVARRRIRGEVIDAVLQAGPALLRMHHSASLARAMTDHVDALDGFFRQWKPAAMLAIAGPALVGIVLLALDWQAGLILIGSGLLVPVGMALAGIGAALATRRQFQALSRLQTRFIDRLRGIATIVLSDRIEEEVAALRASANDLRRRTMRVLRVAFLSSAMLDCAAAFALVMIAIRNHAALHEATFWPVFRAILALLLVPEFFAPLRAFSAAYQDRMHAQEAASHLADLPRPKPTSAPVSPFSPPPRGVALSFQDVSLRWDAGRPAVLDGMSFEVAAGETVLLVGPSGSGKSSVLDVLLGFAKPDHGRAELNGLDVSRLPPHDLCALVSWIGQRPTIFAGTIRDNILIARPDASLQDIGAATRAARVDPFLEELPDGLDTVIGEGGYGLSGGQAQRVAIARAFLKNAPLLLLDEPTSHLDLATEQDVLESLRRLAMGRTVVVATHSDAATILEGRTLYVWEGRIWTGEA